MDDTERMWQVLEFRKYIRKTSPRNLFKID